jgi:hypothetical protein
MANVKLFIINRLGFILPLSTKCETLSISHFPVGRKFGQRARGTRAIWFAF